MVGNFSFSMAVDSKGLIRGVGRNRPNLEAGVPPLYEDEAALEEEEGYLWGVDEFGVRIVVSKPLRLLGVQVRLFWVGVSP